LNSSTTRAVFCGPLGGFTWMIEARVSCRPRLIFITVDSRRQTQSAMNHPAVFSKWLHNNRDSFQNHLWKPIHFMISGCALATFDIRYVPLLNPMKNLNRTRRLWRFDGKQNQRIARTPG
jgi:hypothetical protein